MFNNLVFIGPYFKHTRMFCETVRINCVICFMRLQILYIWYKEPDNVLCCPFPFFIIYEFTLRLLLFFFSLVNNAKSIIRKQLTKLYHWNFQFRVLCKGLNSINVNWKVFISFHFISNATNKNNINNGSLDLDVSRHPKITDPISFS